MKSQQAGFTHFGLTSLFPQVNGKAEICNQVKKLGRQYQ